MRNMVEINNMIEEIDCGNLFDQIDDFFDFPNDNVDTGIFGSSCHVDCAAFPNVWSKNSPEFSAGQGQSHSQSASHLSVELSVPYEDIVQLEWLSTFVENSFSSGGLTLEKSYTTSSSEKEYSLRNQFQTSSPSSVLDSNTSACSRPQLLPVSHEKRARSKRPRPAAFTPRPAFELIQKKRKIRILPLSGGSDEMRHNQNENPNNTGAPVRKCRHCEITKTPQWRAGPMGPKTLCNACGVRYKSGRLYPEYRPAASPTFVPSLHSNSHKKVLEMRGCNPKPEA